MFRFYDDELHNLILVGDKNIKEIISYLSTYDYHPPLQYLLNKFSLQLFGLDEFWMRVPSIIFILLSILLCSKIVFRVTDSFRASLLCGLISIVNPLILLWGSSIRWYPLWTFIAILSIYLTLILLTSSKTSVKINIQILLALTLALALYTNYQSIFLIVALLISAVIFDFKASDRSYSILKKLVPAILFAIILFLPYFGSFENHLSTFIQQNQNNKDFAQSSALLSGGYFIFSVLFGNSIYPWDIKFIIPFIILVISTASIFFLKTDSLKKSLIGSKSIENLNDRKTLLFLFIFSITLFFLFLIQTAATKTISARGLIIFPLLLITLGSVFIYNIKRTNGTRLKIRILIVALSILSIWLIGSYNVIKRQSIHKSSLMNPVSEVISILNKTINSVHDEYIIINYDPVLTYYILKDNSSERALIISPYVIEIKKLLNSFKAIDYNKTININPAAILIYIQGYPGSLMVRKDRLDSLTQYIVKEGIHVREPLELGQAPDSKIKRIFFANSALTDYKYKMIFLKPNNKWDFKILSGFYNFNAE